LAHFDLIRHVPAEVHCATGSMPKHAAVGVKTAEAEAQ